MAIQGPTTSMTAALMLWPEIEVLQQKGKLVVHADVPGLNREDVKVEVKNGALCISGERRSQSERTTDGVYRSERSYGSFYRSIPLPEGANVDTASATFEHGALKIEIDVPSPEQGRKIDVRDGH